ncbi:NUDIX hydrolase domain-like protein [Pisolithus orientalis]|uniref:NUDIX hydrolase domain-like protein n=1 Tax=Pisolithus orientalis TaxID=936130 RepID=UPI0022243D46|nr:NUDIX hydrolase domain-like protein [Pisolithus orientalis]KAI6001668.1 NUDIX hydrolase domain-like protein [Pisolithus orientalis]
MGGSPLNRLSWLRPSQSFLNAVISSPATRWILFNDGLPLIATHAITQKRTLALLPTDDVRPLLGIEPYFGQGQFEGEANHSDAPVLEAARLRGTRIVFLGLKEADSLAAAALPSSDFKDPQATVANLEGTPFFTIEVADLEDSLVKEAIQTSQSLMYSPAAVFAEARSMVDWNRRNKFCPACGSPTYSLWAGWKLSCTSCPSGRGTQNFCHPRTDPVVIMVVMDESGDKILLGRNFYSALAGFVEPGESYEDAVKREMWEEAGVRVRNVRYHSGQPWPFPANLMLGFYATADSSAPIRTDLDNELEDARWYTREEVLAVLAHQAGAHSATSSHDSAGEVEPLFKMPPPTAIAGVLIKQWAEGNSGFDYAMKGNL